MSYDRRIHSLESQYFSVVDADVTARSYSDLAKSPRLISYFQASYPWYHLEDMTVIIRRHAFHHSAKPQ